MSSLEAIALRRGALQARAQGEREQLARNIEPLAGALRIVDRGVNGVRMLRDRLLEHPLLASAALVAAFAVRPRRAMRLVRLGLGAWQAWRVVHGALRAR